MRGRADSRVFNLTPLNLGPFKILDRVWNGLVETRTQQSSVTRGGPDLRQEVWESFAAFSLGRVVGSQREMVGRTPGRQQEPS